MKRLLTLLLALSWFSASYAQGINNPCGNPATATVAGCVKPDGTTISNTAGAISVAAPATAVGTAAVGQIPGSTTNTAASAGNIGQVLTATGTATSLTNITDAVPTGGAVTLTAGDWEISGQACYQPAATTSYLQILASVSTTTATNGTVGQYVQWNVPASVPGGGLLCINIPPFQVLVANAATQVMSLVTQATFSISTMTARGTLYARRFR